MNKECIRTRFAPSPTGFLHIGGARTALFNWLYARHFGGSFVLRVEDTDQQRSTAESTQAILDAMNWLGLDWDEGPIYQAERVEIHRQKVRQLIAEGKAYYCNCSQQTLEEMRKTGSKFVYLDITSKSKNYLSKRFPTIYGECLNQGIDISKEWIPVCPVQHYMMGGILTDLLGRTNIGGLFASGEVANTGVHGANRLASNSMLECLVFARRAAETINKQDKEDALLYTLEVESKELLPLDLDPGKLKEIIQDTMNQDAGVIRHLANLKRAQDKINRIYRTLDGVFIDSKEKAEAYNMALVALEILKAAIDRKESVGAHYRED